LTDICIRLGDGGPHGRGYRKRLYEAFIARIELCYTAGTDSVQAFSGSQLVVSQLNGAYEAKHDTIAAYVRQFREAIKLLKHFAMTHIPCSEN